MELSRGKLLFLAVVTEGAALFIALMAGKFLDLSLFPLTEHFIDDILTGTFGALIPLALFVFSLSKKTEKIPILGSVRKTILTDVKALFSVAQFPDILFISLCAGFAEELLFRGVLQTKLGIIVASILFGLVHCVTPAYVVIATIMGLYLGILFHLYGSVLVPIQAHFIYDLGALLYIRHIKK